MSVVLAEDIDRSPPELDRARGRTDFARELGRPGAELGEVEPGELSRVRYRAPERERPLEVRERLGESEDGLRLASRIDRRGKRVRVATRRLPVRGELSRRRGSAACELVGEPRVQLLALTGQDRPVDRLRKQRVAEAEAAACLVGDEDAVLDRLAERVLNIALRAAPRGRGAARSSRRVRQPRRAAGGPALQGRVGRRAAAAGRAGPAAARASSSPAARSSSAKKGLPSERETIASATVAGRSASL